MSESSKKRKLPDGWVIRYSTRREMSYYFNTQTGDSSWKFPPKNSSKNPEDKNTDRAKTSSTKKVEAPPDSQKNVSETKCPNCSNDEEKRETHNHYWKSEERHKFNFNNISKNKNSINSFCKRVRKHLINEMKKGKNKANFSENLVQNASKFRSKQKYKNKKENASQNCSIETNLIISTVPGNNSKTGMNSRNVICKDLIIPEDEDKNLGANTSNQSIGLEDESADIEMLDLSYLLNCDASQPMQTDEASLNPDLFIVVDTNIFLNHLKYIKRITELVFTDYGYPLIIIPWVVIQELDSLKNNRNAKNVLYKATEAVHFVFRKLKSGHPRIRGQTAAEASFCENNLNAECNDDKILQCCIQLSQKFGKERVILFTEDKNLSNKAFINNIEANNCSDIAKHLKLNIYQCLNSKSTSQSKVLPDLNVGKKTEEKKKKEIENIVSEVQCITKDILSSIIESEMKDIFGDLWMRIVIVKPPWSLLDALKCIERHWIAVFGFLFPQDMKNTIEQFSSLLKNGFCNIDDDKQILSIFEFSSTICLNIQLKFNNNEADIALSKLRELNAKYLSLKQLKSSNSQISDKLVLTENHCAVVATFDYVWDCINYTCGIFMDVLRYPNHGIVYTKPPKLPTEKSVTEMLPVVSDKLRLLSDNMRILISANENEESYPNKAIAEIRNGLLKYTENIDLKFSASPPKVVITVQMIAEFFGNPHNKELLENGCQQLIQFQSKLNILRRLFT